MAKAQVMSKLETYAGRGFLFLYWPRPVPQQSMGRLSHTTLWKMNRLVLFALMAIAGPLLAVTQKYQDALKARIENGYAIVQLADGSKTMVPLSSLSEEDRAWLSRT